MSTAAVLQGVLGDPQAIRRYWEHVVLVPGFDCVWWTGAIAGKGHGRFWLGHGRVIIAHRMAYAIAYGAAALVDAPLLGHTCDNPLCQNVEHLRPKDHWQNAQEWAVRRHRVSWSLRDIRGARGRAVALRKVIRDGGDLQAALAAGDPDREQLSLF